MKYADSRGLHRPKALRQLFGERDGTVIAARASQRHAQLFLALDSVSRRSQRQQLDHQLQEPIRRRLPQDEVAHRLLETGERLEFGIPVRIGQEADIEDEIGLERDPVLEPEGDDVDAQVLAL